MRVTMETRTAKTTMQRRPKMIIIPRGAVVCIIGMPCSGKSTLARRIKEAEPYADAILISADGVFKEVSGRNPDELLNQVIRGERMELLTKYEREYQSVLRTRIGEAMAEWDKTLIYEFMPNTANEVSTFIMLSATLRNERTMVLKMCPDPSVEAEFYEKRRQQGRCFPPEIMQLGKMRTQQILEHDYSIGESMVYEYTIRDPRKLILSFTDAEW